VDAASEIASRRLPSAFVLSLLLAVFIATRLTGGWFADHPKRWSMGELAVGDVRLYQSWADDLVDRHEAAYIDVGIPYPPGLVPFIVAPKYAERIAPYSSAFIKLMEIVDLAGLAGLALIARRTGSWFGPWAWTILIPLLGPIAWTRLDLVPAVATIFAVERAQAGGWTGAGGWMGFGAIAKVYPAFLLPSVVVSSLRRRGTVVAAAVAMLAPLVALIGSMSDVFGSIAQFHWHRGIQIESIWGSALLLAHHAGYTISIFNVAGAMEGGGGVASAFKHASLVLAVGIIVFGVAVAWRRVPRGDAVGLSLVLLGTLALLTGVGTIYSPQYLIWLFALASVVGILCGRRAVIPIVVLGAMAILSQIVFPFLYGDLLSLRLLPAVLLAIRNVLTLALGVMAFRLAWHARRAHA
jgi:hypothetical protein